MRFSLIDISSVSLSLYVYAQSRITSKAELYEDLMSRYQSHTAFVKAVIPLQKKVNTAAMYRKAPNGRREISGSQ